MLNKALPSVLSPTITVAPPNGKVYETPSTARRSAPVELYSPFRSNSARAPVVLPLPASREISSESSPVKLVFKSIWKP